MTPSAHAAATATHMEPAAGVGRLLWAALEGPAIDREAALLLDRGAGGVVLFSRNIASATALRELVAELRARAARPLRVAIDHEGGHVARIGAPLTRWPSAMAIAAAGSLRLATAVATASARELGWLGIDVNLAPVLDIASVPANAAVGVRAFSSSADVVARFGRATITGHRAGGVASVAKHFPGHGRTAGDSHVGLPIIGGGSDALRTHDLPPFRSAIDGGVEALMVGHVAYAGLTAGEPATISGAVMTGLLRGELGYDGFVMTDALNMRAITDRLAIPEACTAAVMAGADAVLPLERQLESLDALQRAVDAGVLTTDRVAASARRAARLDRTIADLRAGQPADGWDRAEHKALAAEVARRSLTLVRGEELLPIPRSARVAVVEFASRRPSPVEENIAPEPTFGARLTTRLPGVRRFDVTPGTTEEERTSIIGAAGMADIVITATRDAYLWEDEQTLLKQLVSTGRPVLLVALRNPFDLVRLPRALGAIAAYGDVPATLDAVADALVRGHGAFTGRLPMHLPRLENAR
jgi:beta-N-acetylhexosaminidase